MRTNFQIAIVTIIVAWCSLGLAGCDSEIAVCFPGETLINTPAGPVPISRITAGDSVVTVNPSTGARGVGVVVGNHRTPSAGLLHFTLADGSELRVTAHHPLWHHRRGATLCLSIVLDPVGGFRWKRYRASVGSSHAGKDT